VLGGLVDPRLFGQAWRLGLAAEPLGVLCVGTVEGGLASCADVGRGSIVDRGRGVHSRTPAKSQVGCCDPRR
jgi:hypothetical protein